MTLPRNMSEYTKWAIAHPWHVTGAEPRPAVPEDCDCDTCIKARIDFRIWCDTFDQRWQEHKVTECPLCGGPLNDGSRLFHKECADREQMEADAWGDPAYNNHPAAWR